MQIAWNFNMFQHGGTFWSRCCCPRSINSQLIFKYITVSLTVHTYKLRPSHLCHSICNSYVRDTFCVTFNALRLLLVFFFFSLCFCVTLSENQRRRHTWTGYKWNEDARVFHSIYSKHDNSTLTTSFQLDTRVFRSFLARRFVLLGLNRSVFTVRHNYH